MSPARGTKKKAANASSTIPRTASAARCRRRWRREARDVIRPSTARDRRRTSRTSLFDRPAGETGDELSLRCEEHDCDRYHREEGGQCQFGPEDIDRLAAAAGRRVERRRRREQVG